MRAGISVTASNVQRDRLAARHRRDMHAHMRDVEHVGAAEAVPRVHHAVLAERDGDAGARISGTRVMPRRFG